MRSDAELNKLKLLCFQPGLTEGHNAGFRGDRHEFKPDLVVGRIGVSLPPLSLGKAISHVQRNFKIVIARPRAFKSNSLNDRALDSLKLPIHISEYSGDGT